MEANYYQIVEQTLEEQVLMYKKLSKKELIAMLIEANRHLNNLQPKIMCCNNYNPDTRTTGMLCINCGQGKYKH